MRHTTKWKPDTCGCILEYEWDDTVEGVENSMKLFKVHRRCPAHSVPDNSLMTVLEENQRKNRVLGEILDRFPALTIQDGDGVWFAPGKEPSWDFTTDRKLRINMGVAISAAQKTALRNIFNAKWPDKVEIL